ncbi:MAG: hypothetical protein ACFFG0_29920 [Candidatus Thorarchaeota archaeon]
MVFEILNNNQGSNGSSIIIVDICESFFYYIEFLKRNEYLRYISVIDGFISERFKDIHLNANQINTLETKLAFKIRDMINRSQKLGYIIKVYYNKYKITEKINDLKPLVLDLLNSRISSFTL